MLRIPIAVLTTACFWPAFAGSTGDRTPETALTLPRAIELALENNPELQAIAINRQISESQRIQAGMRINPELELEFENLAGSGSFAGFDSAESTIAMGQTIELAGKRRKRVRAAGFLVDRARWEMEAKRLDIITDTWLAFVDVLAAQKREELQRDLYQTAQQVAATVEARVEAGKVSPLESIKAEITVTNARMQLQETTEQLKALRLVLAGFWGQRDFPFESVDGRLDVLEIVPEPDALEDAVNDNPDVARRLAELSFMEAQLVSERAERIPDLTLKLGYKRLHDTNDSAWVAGVSLPVPLFDRNRHNISKARYEVEKASAAKRARENQLRVRLAETLQSLKTAYNQAITLKDRILPAAQLAFDGTRVGYREGKFEYLEVLDAQRTYFEVNIQYTQWLAQYQRKRAELVRLTGHRLETVISEGGK